MDKSTLKKIGRIVAELEGMGGRIGALRDREEKKRDNVPHGLRFTESYERLEHAHECLDSACEMLDDVVCALNRIY